MKNSKKSVAIILCFTLIFSMVLNVGIDQINNKFIFGAQVGAAEEDPPFTTTPKIAAGGAHYLQLKSDGTVWAWGDNTYGQLGDGTNTSAPSPKKILGLSNIKEIACGTNHSMALDSNGVVWTWGYNINGELGDGTNVSKNIPVKVIAGGIKAISTKGNHCLVINYLDEIYAWGLNNFGQLGDGTVINKNTPTKIALGSNYMRTFKFIESGANHSMAIGTDGFVYAWGRGADGELGYVYTGGQNYYHPSPVNTSIDILNNNRFPIVTSISCSDGTYAYALWGGGAVRMWGTGQKSMLVSGRDDEGVRYTYTQYYCDPPVDLQTVPNIESIYAGINKAYALKTDHTLWQLSTGTPTQVTTNSHISKVASRGNIILLLLDDDTLWKLTEGSTTPTQIPTSDFALNSASITGVTLNTLTANWSFRGTKPGMTYKLGVCDANNNLVKENVWTSNLSDTVTGLGLATTYKAKVMVKYSHGFTSGWFDIGSATTTTWNLSLTPSNITQNSVNLTISDNNINTAFYEISSGGKYVNASGNLVDTQQWISLPTKTITVNNLTLATTYNFKVRAKADTGYESGYSPAVQVTTAAWNISLTTSNVTTTSVDLKITDSNSATSLYQITSGGKYVNELGKLVTTATWIALPTKSIKVTELFFNTQYSFQVKAKTASGQESPLSSAAIITTLNDSTKMAITNITTSGTTNSITWNSVTGALSYDLEVNGVINNVGAVTYSHTGIQINAINRYRVRAVTASGTTPWSGYTTNRIFTLTATNGNIIDLGLRATKLTNFSKNTMEFTFDTTKLAVEDLCSITDTIETTTGAISAASINIISFTTGKVRYQVNKTIPTGKQWSGLTNSIRFKALATGSTNVSFTIYENAQ